MGYLVAAYLILWLGILSYLLWMGGTLRGVRADLRDLRAAVRGRETGVAVQQQELREVDTPVELRRR